MNSRTPYLLRALYEWIADNNCTPHIVVDAYIDYVSVPLQHVQDGRIVLNVGMSAVQNLELGNEAITFSARFSGRVEHIYIPINAVLAIYARENGEGLVFDAIIEAGETSATETAESSSSAVKTGPNLTAVDNDTSKTAGTDQTNKPTTLGEASEQAKQKASAKSENKTEASHQQKASQLARDSEVTGDKKSKDTDTGESTADATDPDPSNSESPNPEPPKPEPPKPPKGGKPSLRVVK